MEISFRRMGMRLYPPGHPQRSRALNKLGLALQSRYDKFGKITDLEDSISFHRDALALRPPGHPDRSESLNNFATALSRRYDKFGKIDDLEECISILHDALALYPPGHPYRFLSLDNLASALSRRYTQFEKTEDLEDCTSFLRDALALQTPGHPYRSSSLSSLANALSSRYDRFGKIADLEECIVFHREILAQHPPGHPYRSRSLSSLANDLSRRYAQFGKTEDLEDCICFQRDALALIPIGHPLYFSSLSRLANALSSRYDNFGRIEDLEESISFHRDVLALHPPGYPYRSSSLSNLANDLSRRYTQFGKIEDLEDCISLRRETLALHSPGHPKHSMFLNNLAISLSSRYDRFGKIEDLEDSISFLRNTLALHPAGHPYRFSSLSSLANALNNRYTKFGEIEDLEESISFQHDILAFHPPGHPYRSSSLNSLAISLSTRFDKFGKIEDLEDCISFLRDALALLPPGHPSRSSALNNLANTLSDRYDKFYKIEDLEDSISFQRDALALRPPGHPDHSRTLDNLARALSSRYGKFSRIQDLEEAFSCYEQATGDLTSHLINRLYAAVRWARTARFHQHNSLLAAYSASLDLLNRSLISRPSVESQHGFLATARIPKSLASEAASAAIEAKHLELAVELLEQGRAMLWSKVDSYKFPLEQLRTVQGGVQLADRLEILSAELEHLVLVSSNRDGISDNKSSTGLVDPFDAHMKRHRTLSEEWDGLVSRIRHIEGFGSFLRAAPFNTLRSAAAEGPVVLVNISRYRSDAIILHIDHPLVLVPLQNIRLGDLNEQTQKLESEIGSVLRYLWENIVCHVVTCLNELGVQKKSRIWWCPTGELCALPLHAAGTYRRNKLNLPDIYTSSYISTLSSLIRARSNIHVRPSMIPNLLVVGQPSTDLERVVIEVDAIKKLGPTNSVDVLLREEANCEAVLHGLKQHSWVHFACHGRLGPGNNAEPFQASFELDGGRRLPLLDLIRARVPNAELAFLSACHSAAGDSRTPDENIHLSAALQFCGFRSVVGTLWEMDDEDGPMISEEFYKYMFRNPEKINFRDAAFALSSAIRAMRKAKLPPERWVMFVHIGA